MYDLLADVAGELVAAALAAALAVVVAGLGVLAELSGLHELGAGHLFMGLWFAVLGAVALYVGVVQLGLRTARDGLVG